MEGQEGLKVSVRREHGEVVIRVQGELDLATGQTLVDAITQAKLDPAARVALDMEHVCFIDSEACKSLLLARRRLETQGGRLRLVKCSEQVMKTLNLLSLEKELGTEPLDSH